jgi:hypothetical protein
MQAVWKRIVLAFRCFFVILLRGEIPGDVVRELSKPASPARPLTGRVQGDAKPPAAGAEKPSSEPFDRAVQVLALLQRDGRLIDFLTEDVSPYPDEQLGAAVRDIHANCRQVLARYLQIEPIAAGTEDQPFTVPAGFDPATIKLIGNVKGAPPLSGVLRHRGWRVKGFNLPALPQGSGRTVVAAAEVEIA